MFLIKTPVIHTPPYFSYICSTYYLHKSNVFKMFMHRCIMIESLLSVFFMAIDNKEKFVFLGELD